MVKSAFKYRIEKEPKPSDVPIGSLVRLFFNRLDEQGLSWAVLRGSEGLPDYTRYDIDLLIRPEDTGRAEAVLREAATEEGWSVVRIVDKFAYRCCLLISPGPERRYLPIDLFGGCHHRFYPIADGRYGLDASIRNDQGVMVVPTGFGAAVALLKELTRHPDFKENSRDEVRTGTLEDADSFRRGLVGVLNENLIERLLGFCQSNDWGGVASLVPEIRLQVQQTRSRVSSDAIDFFTSNVRHHLTPPMSGHVVLLGPDGSGKSTIADLVAESFYKQPFKICQRYEYNFRIVPELKQLKKRIAKLLGRKVTEQKSIAPGTKGSGMNRDHSCLKGMGYVSYYALDFILGRLPLFKLRGQGAVCIFARYFQDYYYQRGYGNVPRWYLRFLESLTPRPDLILYLDRDAGEIYRGKPELDIDEIQRQQKVIRNIVAERAHGELIDASEGVDATVQKVRERVIQLFLSRHGIGD
ncbi:hypothetical protein NT6N_26900 [Oceaniferula spumae]|uniref:Thymidylate kinase-like domain-containing protein n=1 Tax=Oceaniferula spumae TaxID=2979115 RepID=A0AAT9FNS6_9BACT